ncbi:ABC transporter permease [Roseivirga sp.]|uniref:ABC transporter permease n=1 Tax=Roseivirga sp. TaxID=1964215 RepID=UPI002B278DDB|nr:ABC transporter permease [Roseivirga sp.]
MLRNYIKSAFTNLKRNTGYTLLMIFSLALGMYCFVMAGLYVRYEYSRNLNHANADRVYRIMLDFGEYKDYITEDFAEQIKTSNPEIEELNTINGVRGDLYLSADGEAYLKEGNGFYTDNNVFDVFSFPLKYGNPQNALEGTGKVVISSSLSETLFPNKNPVGEEIQIHEKGTFLISGVMDQVSELSVFNPGLFFSMEEFKKEMADSNRAFFYLLTHVKLKEEVSKEQLEEGVFRTAQNVGAFENLKGIYTENLADAYWGNSIYDYGAQYYSLFGASKKMIKTVMYITFGVLLCAFLGYVAIALSLSLKRAKEVGIRKVNGANVKEIRTQFLMESVVYAVVALLLTVVALELSEKSISDLFQVPVGLRSGQPEVIIFLIVFTLFTGLVAGLYPSLVVSKLNPVKVLSGFSSPRGAGFILKRVLLTTQFVITICLVFGVYVLKLQVTKMNHFDTGYNVENVLTFGNSNPKIKKNAEVINERLKNLPGVQKVAKGPFPFNFNGFSNIELQLVDTLIKNNPSRIYVSDNFFDLVDIELEEGNVFSDTNTPLENACIINERLAKELGLQSPVGTTLNVDGKPKTIVGLANDISTWGVGSPDPMAHIFLPDVNNIAHSYLIKVKPESRDKLVASLESIWKEYETVIEPDITQLDQKVNGSVQNMSKISTLFSILAGVVLLLSFMNLFGMAIMFANSKMKAVSIRKILGASVPELLGRLSLPFLYSLIIALLIALPIGYYLMEQYLQDYAVRISLNAGQGLIAGVFMIVLLFVVIGFKMLQFSKTNPVEVLRKE